MGLQKCRRKASKESGDESPHSKDDKRRAIPRAAESETFRRNANGVRAINSLPVFTPTLWRWGDTWKRLIQVRVEDKFGSKPTGVTPSQQQPA